MSSEALLKYKAAKCGQLLAQSFLSDEIKNVISENIGKVTEDDLDRLLESLEREQLELERLEKEFGEFEREENEEWKKLQVKQEEMTQKMLDEFLVSTIKLNL